MPVNHNNAGASESSVPYVNQGGSPVECNVYVNQGGTAVAVHEVAAGTPITVHDDFESYADTTALRAAWDTDTSDIDLVTSGAPEGAQAVASNLSQVYATRGDLTSNDDEEWSAIVEFTDGGATTAGVLSHVQDNSGGGPILDDCIRCRLDLANNELDMQVYENGANQVSESAGVASSLSTGVPYRVGVTFASDSAAILGYVRNADTGEVIADGVLDYQPAWSSGIPGIYWQDSGLANADVFRSDTEPDRLIDNFEISPNGVYASGDSITTSVWTQNVGTTNYSFNSTDAITGSRCLEMDATGDFNLYVSQPSDGLPFYASEGDVFGAYMMEHDPGAQPCIGWYGSGNDGYTLQIGTEGVNAENQFQFRRWDAGSTTAIGETVSSSNLSSSTWYWAEVELATGGNYTARLYDVDQSTGVLTSPGSPIHEITATDTTHTANSGMIVGNRATGGMGRFDGIRRVGTV